MHGLQLRVEHVEYVVSCGTGVDQIVAGGVRQGGHAGGVGEFGGQWGSKARVGGEQPEQKVVPVRQPPMMTMGAAIGASTMHGCVSA